MTKSIEIICIGTELLIGKTLNTNGQWLAKRATALGLKVNRIITVMDETNETALTIKEALRRKNRFIITIGGLGPTFDDMTLEGIARGLNRRLELNEHAYNLIKKVYERAYKRGLLQLEGMTKEREKMAYLPQGSTPLPNTVGTAPGVKLSEENTVIFILPGVPAEIKAMFRNVITPILKDQQGKFIERNFLFSGIGESQILLMLPNWKKNILNFG